MFLAPRMRHLHVNPVESPSLIGEDYVKWQDKETESRVQVLAQCRGVIAVVREQWD